MGLSSQFTVKFNNFSPIIGWANVDTIIITKAWIELYPFKNWPGDSTAFLDISVEQIAPDTALSWSNYLAAETVDSIWEFLSLNGISLIQDTTVSITDVVEIPINLELLNQWRKNLILNNGLRFISSEENENLMAAFYAYDHSLEYSPKLKIQCSVSDSSGILPADTLVTLYSTGDLQYSENKYKPDFSQLILSQGVVYMPWLKMPALRDTIPENAIINKAFLAIEYDDNLSYFDERSKIIQLKYLYSDNWESSTASIDIYLQNTSAVYDTAKNIVFDLSRIIQYYIAGGSRDAEARFRFSFLDEQEGFSRIILDAASVRLDLYYTLMTTKPGENE
ncbi:MAG TPA: hypothetical protein ENN84_02590 [Candidatus Marinimicrobia bacterium]|nr:hypothetical protein [Candidatus Neomarinimicrobiota bacterium]